MRLYNKHCEGMKMLRKYKVSEWVTRGAWIGLFTLLLSLAFVIVFLICTGADRDEVFRNELLVFYTVVAVGIIASVEVLLFDTPSFRFSVSEIGITMYIRFKEYLVQWDEIVQWDILSTTTSVNTSKRVFWLYFSKRKLGRKELNRFVKLALKERGTIAFFQCGYKKYSEIRQYIPLEMRDKLDSNFEILDSIMAKKERR